MLGGLEKILALCEEAKLRSCERLKSLLEGSARIPEDLLLQALIGALADLEGEAAKAGLDELATLAAEARRDAEWALSGSGW